MGQTPCNYHPFSNSVLLHNFCKTNSIAKHALALADENSPIYLQGIFKAIKSYFKDEEEFLKMFRGERTLSWMDHNPSMAEGFAEFLKSGYIGNLINSGGYQH